MLRPRDSHDLRLKEAWFVFSPPATVNWFHDVFGNSIAMATFADATTELRIESNLRLEHCGLDRPSCAIDPMAAHYPFAYSQDDYIDLGRLREPHYADPGKRLTRWAEGFIFGPRVDTLALLADLNTGIRASLGYQTRDEEGTQTPIETLDRGFGSCRDFAVLMVEAARSLGFGARIATGYLYNPETDGLRSWTINGSGGTHAWVEIYLPGAGWIAYDPTNGTIGSTDLIRIAVARHIGQVVPVAGSFIGRPDDVIGMRVSATVTSDSGRAQWQVQ